MFSSSSTNKYQHYYPLENPTKFKSLGIGWFQPSLDISGELCFPFSLISYPSPVQFLGRGCQRSVHTSNLVALCWMGASWPPTIFMLEDILCQFPIVKDLIRDVGEGQVLIIAFNPLAAQKHVLYRQAFSS